MRIIISVKDGDAIERRLAEAKTTMGDLRPLMDDIGSYLVTSTLRRFEHGFGPGDLPWQPSQRAMAEAGKTLTDTARLMHSITHAAFTDHVQVGTNMIYAAIHQFGGKIKKHAQSRQLLHHYDAENRELTRFAKRSKANFATWHEVKEHEITMPARPFLGIDARDMKAIERRIELYLTGALN